MPKPNYSPVVRLQSMHNGPLRSMNDYQFGFYDCGILRTVLEHLDGSNFRMATLPIPNTPYEAKIAESIIRHPDICYAVVDKNKIALVIVEDSPGWLNIFNDMGYEVFAGDKTGKRLKTFHRAALLNAHFGKDELNIKVVDPRAYTRHDFTNANDEDYIIDSLCTQEVTDRLLDGGFVISRKLIERAVQNIPTYQPHNTTDTKEYYYDWRIRNKMVKDMMNQKVFNARIIYEGGFIKGNCIVVDPEFLPEGVDVITAPQNIKNEIVYHNGYQFLAEPQSSHERVITDDQTVINLPKLFRKADMTMWLEEEYKKMFESVTNSQLLNNWKELYKREFRNIHGAEDEEANSRMSYVGYRWVASGMKVIESPWLFETLATSHAKPFRQRIPIPCSVYEQVIPESLARMAGYDIEVETETIHRINELGVHVVNDVDWLEMYASHGGHDEDDYFKCFYREMEGGFYDGEKVVIVVRSPNGYGEYSIFRYVEGQWAPKWHKADGTEVTFPKVNGRNWPKRLSHAVNIGDVSYGKFPSELRSKNKPTGSYTPDNVVHDMHVAMSGGNVGGYVNSVMAHSLVLHRHRPVQLCSLEKAIDKCINPDDIEDVRAIDKEAENIVREIIDSGKPIDIEFWERRGFSRYLKADDEITFHEGKITQMYKLCAKFYHEYCEQVRNWAQENARPDEVIHQLGERMYFRALPIVKSFRSNIYRVNTSETTSSAGSIVRNSWESLYQTIVDAILSHERIEDQHDFVLGLYSVSLNVPTTGGKITDQIVLNRFVYPYLEAALHFYGITRAPVFNATTDGDVEISYLRRIEWVWQDELGNQVRYKHPVDFQKAHSQDSPVLFNIARPNNPQPRTSSLY
jgi:hypothetical protein